MHKIPVLMITHNRLAYTQQALKALVESDCHGIYIFDNGSDDGTREWLEQYSYLDSFRRSVFHYSSENIGISGAMNWFLEQTSGFQYCVKVDNDTIIPADFCARMLPHMEHTDLLQAKHFIIPATNPDGWDGFTKRMIRRDGLLFYHFIGGSGIVFRRSSVNHIPETENKIGGWRQFQRENPHLKKAFCEDVEIKLLDEHGYRDYPEYYKTTGRC